MPISNVSGSRLILVVALFALFYPVAFGYRSLTGLLIPLALVALFALAQLHSTEPIWRALFTPYAPFMILLVIVAPSQEDPTRAIALVSVAVVYVFARMMRLIFPVHWLAFGIATIALAVGALRQLGISPLGNQFFIERLADINGRNPAGLAVGFGLIAAIVLYLRFLRRPPLKWLMAALSSALFLLLIFSDVVGAVVSAGVAVLSAGVLIAVKSRGTGRLASDLRPLSRAFLWGSGIIGLLLAIANLFQTLHGGFLSFLQRDFTNFTGRDVIWRCYFDTLSAGSANVLDDTVACSGLGIGNLHNVYLQSHLFGGILLALALVAALVWVISISVVRALRAESPRDLADAMFGVGVTVMGLLMGIVEAFLYSHLFFGALVFLLGPAVSKRPLPQQLRDLRQVSFRKRFANARGKEDGETPTVASTV